MFSFLFARERKLAEQVRFQANLAILLFDLRPVGFAHPTVELRRIAQRGYFQGCYVDNNSLEITDTPRVFLQGFVMNKTLYVGDTPDDVEAFFLRYGFTLHQRQLYELHRGVLASMLVPDVTRELPVYRINAELAADINALYGNDHAHEGDHYVDGTVIAAKKAYPYEKFRRCNTSLKAA